MCKQGAYSYSLEHRSKSASAVRNNAINDPCRIIVHIYSTASSWSVGNIRSISIPDGKSLDYGIFRQMGNADAPDCVGTACFGDRIRRSHNVRNFFTVP